MIKGLLADSAIYGIGRIIPQAVGFLLLPTISHYITPSDYGRYSLYQVIIAITTIVFTLSIDRSVYRLYWNYTSMEERRNYISTIWTSLTALLFVVCSMATLIIHIYVNISGVEEYQNEWLCCVGLLAMQPFGTLMGIFYQVERKAVKFSIQAILVSIVTAVTTYLLITVNHIGVSALLIGQILGCASVLPFCGHHWVTNGKVLVNWVILRATVSFSYPIVPILLASWVLSMGDRAILSLNANMFTVGLYAMAVKLASVYTISANSLFQAYNPIYNKHRTHSRNVSELNSLNSYICILLLVGAIIAILNIKWIGSLLLSDAYSSSLTYAPILVLGCLLSVMSGFTNLDLYFDKKVKSVMKAQISSAAIHLFLVYTLAKQFGVIACVIAMLAANSVLIILKRSAIKNLLETAVPWSPVLTTVIFAALFTFARDKYLSPVWGRIAISLPITVILSLLGIVWIRYVTKRRSAIFATKG